MSVHYILLRLAVAFTHTTYKGVPPTKIFTKGARALEDYPYIGVKF